MHPFQIIERGDVILWKYNMLPTAGLSNVQSHSSQPQSSCGFQECSAGTPGAAHLPGTGPQTHQDTGAKYNLP